MIHVLIADDHPLIVWGMEACLKKMYPDCSVHSTSNFTDALTLVKKQAMDLIILDLTIPGGLGSEMIQTLRKIQKEVKILIYSGRDELTNAPHYIGKGANGYLQKNSEEAEMTMAIKKVMSDQKHLSSAVKNLIVTNFVDNNSILTNPIENLTPLEKEVLDLLVRGSMTNDIAKKLNMKFSTASTHKIRILKKLKVTTIFDLIATVERLTNHC